MLKPFQILWELIEFGLQALFLFVLAIIFCIGLITYAIVDSKSTFEPQKQIQYIYPKETIEKTKECKRPSGCRILEDGTIEY